MNRSVSFIDFDWEMLVIKLNYKLSSNYMWVNVLRLCDFLVVWLLEKY